MYYKETGQRGRLYVDSQLSFITLVTDIPTKKMWNAVVWENAQPCPLTQPITQHGEAYLLPLASDSSQKSILFAKTYDATWRSLFATPGLRWQSKINVAYAFKLIL